jgi:hypothetical protein
VEPIPKKFDKHQQRRLIARQIKLPNKQNTTPTIIRSHDRLTCIDLRNEKAEGNHREESQEQKRTVAEADDISCNQQITVPSMQRISTTGN